MPDRKHGDHAVLERAGGQGIGAGYDTKKGKTDIERKVYIYAD